MKATATPINRRITLRLDLAIAFEALILNRLLRLPKCRREEWLRGLLIQGFQQESRALKNLQRAGQTSSNATRTQDITTHPLASVATHQSPMPQAKADRPPKPAAINAQHSGNTVSFAALRKVIG